MFTSAQITKLDMAIRYFTEDIFEDGEIHRKMAEQYYEARRENKVNRQRAFSPQAWLQNHNVGDTLAALVGHRARALERFHLLTFDIAGRPLSSR